MKGEMNRMKVFVQKHSFNTGTSMIGVHHRSKRAGVHIYYRGSVFKDGEYIYTEGLSIECNMDRSAASFANKCVP